MIKSVNPGDEGFNVSKSGKPAPLDATQKAAQAGAAAAGAIFGGLVGSTVTSIMAAAVAKFYNPKNGHVADSTKQANFPEKFGDTIVKKTKNELTKEAFKLKDV